MGAAGLGCSSCFPGRLLMDLTPGDTGSAALRRLGSIQHIKYKTDDNSLTKL